MENQIIDTLKNGLDSVSSDLKKEVAAIDAKTTEMVADLNEKAQKNSTTLGELKEQVNQVIAAQGKLKAEKAEKFGTRFEAMKSYVADLINDNYEAIKSETPFQSKTVGVMTLGTNLTGTSQISYVPNSLMRAYYNPKLYEVFNIIPTATGNVTFPRGNSPVGEGSFGAQTEGSAKAQVDYDVTMVNVSVPFIAGYAKVSRQMLQDLPFLQSYLSTSLVEDWNQAVNTRFLNTMATNGTAGSTSASVTAEKFIDYIAQHGALGLGNANLILTTFTAWATVLKTKPSDYSIPGGITIGANGETRIAGIPVVPHAQVTASKVYVLNTDAFAIAQASPLAVRSTEFDQDDFIKNLVTYRAEARIELLSFQPTACVYGAI